MDDLISRQSLIEDLNKVAMEHHESHIPLTEHEFRELIHNAPEIPLEEVIRDYNLCGYSFKELIIFADACRKSEIQEKDLKDFCDVAESAVKYAYGQMQAELDDFIKKGNS